MQELCQEHKLLDKITNSEVMRAHQYKKPDRTLGASKMPDPLRVFIGGVIYKLQKKE